MVSKKSIKEATEHIEKWDIEHPHASFYEKVVRGKQHMVEILEPDYSLSTLPSVVLPTPDYIVKRLKKLRK